MLSSAFVPVKALYTAAGLGVADVLHQHGPLPASDLASRLNVKPAALARVLRCLAAHGVFKETSPGMFANNRGSSVLRADHPTSMRSMLLTWGDESYWAHENLADSLQLGSPPAFQLQSGGVPYFDWLQQPGNEGRSQAFHRAMAEAARALMNAASLEDYPWHMHAAATHTVADVGGGLGSWLAALLEHEPGLRGALVDLPSVVAGAEELWRRERPQLLGRTSFVGADFFSDLLPPADVYFLRFILHDWPDAEATAILRAVRRAVRPGSSAVLLVQDIVMPALQPGVLFTTLDLQMLAIGGGKERTRQEWEALLAAAGFRLARVHRLRALPSLLEAHPA